MTFIRASLPGESPRHRRVHMARSPRLKALAAAAAACCAVALTAPAASAAPRNPITHPDRDWLGSQVAKHMPSGGPAVITPNVTQTPGLDVSSWQGNINWSAVAANGAKFAYVKATESTNYTNPYFSQQYTGAYYAGIVHGAYHFATPNTSSGAAQADYFVAHGGGWSRDGMTFPGMLDMEWNPYGSACYGLSPSAMVNWILSFSNEYHAKTSRWPVIYTATSWWSQCTGNQGDFSSTNPLMLANYNGSPGPMPYNWGYQTIWQYADSGTFPGDQDLFNGDMTRVKAPANGRPGPGGRGPARLGPRPPANRPSPSSPSSRSSHARPRSGRDLREKERERAAPALKAARGTR